MTPCALIRIPSTSLCNNLRSYHEHVSFFTAHSFYAAARLSNLEIVNFETTPIHGKSCLVTFVKATGDKPRALSASLQIALDAELSQGLKDGRLLANFKREALSTRSGLGFEVLIWGATGYSACDLTKQGLDARAVAVARWTRLQNYRVWSCGEGHGSFALSEAIGTRIRLCLHR